MVCIAEMREISTNTLLAEKFLRNSDGLSMGSNDLTQLTLGVDRDSGWTRGFNERNEVVTLMMKMAIDAYKKTEKYIGIFGQAPSDFSEITRWLVEQAASVGEKTMQKPSANERKYKRNERQ